MGARRGWYLIAYDIGEPRRLQRVHRVLKRRAMPVQESVFFFEGHEGALRRLLDDVAEVMSLREDDLRAWPVDRIGAAWMYGAGDLGRRVLAPGGWRQRIRAWWRRRVA